MRALDLFCKAGGASIGLHEAGFDVTGVDIEPQPNYPFRFIHWDALYCDPSGFDFVWASPPCQHSTAYRRRPGHVKNIENLIPAIRTVLEKAGKPYVIENVEGAREHLRNPTMLCGSMFGLDVQRHRLFETSFPLLAPECRHEIWKPRFPAATNRKNLRKTVEVGVWRIPLEVQKQAMGIKSPMTLVELSNAIPPAYSRYIAEQYFKGVA